MRESLIDAIDRKGALNRARTGTCAHCPSPITLLEYDTTRGIRQVGRAKRSRLRFECAHGHIEDFQVTARIALRVNDLLQAQWKVPAGSQS